MNAPDHLSDAQAEIYEDALDELRGTITTARLRKLEAYATERARWLEAEAYVQEHGDVLILRSDKGVVLKVIEAPQLKIGARAQDRALKLAAELGL